MCAEIVGQLMLFLIAGYETTANSLSYVAYHFIMDEKCQERAREEVQAVTQVSDTNATLSTATSTLLSARSYARHCRARRQSLTRCAHR